jgi:osmotically-inducible protein OsmY
MLDDDELQALITERLDEDPSFWTGTGKNRTVITVEVNDGQVTLHGVVRAAADRRRADLLARALGASSVDNRLRVSDEFPSPKPRRVA